MCTSVFNTKVRTAYAYFVKLYVNVKQLKAIRDTISLIIGNQIKVG